MTDQRDTAGWGERCARCNSTRYEHRDHDHERLMNPPWPLPPRLSCPFGDCGEFQSPNAVEESRQGASNGGEQ